MTDTQAQPLGELLANSLKNLVAENERLHEALQEIKELTKRQQLPLTHQIYVVASEALKEPDDGSK